WGRARASAEMGPHLAWIREIIVASMGPRSCERGNEECSPLASQKTLQASMGPRSCERGNRREPLRAQAVLHASMGPRSCERGNVTFSDLTSPAHLSFNGAALVRARKCCRSGYCRLELHCFNGAALVRVRKCRQRSETAVNLSFRFNGAALVRARKSFFVDAQCVSSVKSLQWGRARASAEIRRPLQRRKRLIVASMGPRSCERGNAAYTLGGRP